MPQPLDPECLFKVLDDHGVDYVLIGGLAAVLHGSTVLTNDADICAHHEPTNLARLRSALLDLQAHIRSEDSPDGVAFDPHPALLGSVSMLNMTTRCGDLDLTFAPPALDDYASLAESAVVMDLGGVAVRVAALSDIIRSKAAADRPKDRAVLPILRALQDEIARRNG